MNRLTKFLTVTVGAGLVIVAGASAHAAVTPPSSEDSPIPRCVNDDFNDGTQDFCYTVRVTDGAIIVIDRSDTVVSVGK